MTLEIVDACPACGSRSSSIVHANVPDFVFQASKERWTILGCAYCDSLYLRERPDIATIGEYYKKYYTHNGSDDGPEISGISLNSSFLRRMANSWRNHRYGTQRDSLGKLGVAMMLCMPPVRGWIDAECRHLPAPHLRAPGFRVLDIGCGDGRFVKLAQDAGCESMGFEVDPQAVAHARQSGLDIHQGGADRVLELFGPSSFDWITLSHVIEHVYHPRHTLQVLHDLLRPGGHVWLETPNPRSFGHRLFRDRWRDLDPPRHLCLLSRRALHNAAGDAGLRLVAEHRRPFVPFETFPFSAAARTLDGEAQDSAWRIRMICLEYELRSVWESDGREWLTSVFTRTEN